MLKAPTNKPTESDPLQEPVASGPLDGIGGGGGDTTNALEPGAVLCHPFRYRAYFDLAPMGIAVLSTEERWIDINPQMCRLLGFSESEIRAKHWTELIHPAEHADSRRSFQRLLSGTGPTSVDRLYVRKDGSAVCVSETTQTLESSNGDVEGCVFIVRDITEQKKLQEQLLQSRKMEAVGLLASGIAHDFNNILQVIISATELAMKETIEGGGHARLEQVVSAAECASVFARQLLTIGTGEQPERRPTDVNEEIHLSANFLSGLVFPNKLELWLGTGLPTIYANQDQLRQILINLALNARDAIPDTGTVTIRTDSVALDEAFCRQHLNTVPGRYVAIDFEDSGTGMDEQTLERVFEPFFTTKSPTQGSGLGLALVYGIVKSHLGHIAASTEPGEGTRFRIYLPVSSPQSQPPDGDCSATSETNSKTERG